MSARKLNDLPNDDFLGRAAQYFRFDRFGQNDRGAVVQRGDLLACLSLEGRKKFSLRVARGRLSRGSAIARGMDLFDALQLASWHFDLCERQAANARAQGTI